MPVWTTDTLQQEIYKIVACVIVALFTRQQWRLWPCLHHAGGMRRGHSVGALIILDVRRRSRQGHELSNEFHDMEALKAHHKERESYVNNYF